MGRISTVALSRCGLLAPHAETDNSTTLASRSFVLRSNLAPSTAPTDLNHLRRGTTYRAFTAAGNATGEYLGVETTHGVWSILLRHDRGTDSIPFFRIESIAAA